MKKNITFKRFIYNESKLDMHSAAAALKRRQLKIVWGWYLQSYSSPPQLQPVRYVQPSIFGLITSDRVCVSGTAHSSREPRQVRVGKHSRWHYIILRSHLSADAILAFRNKLSWYFRMRTQKYNCWLHCSLCLASNEGIPVAEHAFKRSRLLYPGLKSLPKAFTTESIVESLAAATAEIKRTGKQHVTFSLNAEDQVCRIWPVLQFLYW